MTSLFDKLNLVIRARIHDFMEENALSESVRRFFPDEAANSDLGKDVADMRSRLNEALEYENTLQGKIDALYQEIVDWDQKADQAIAESREDDARFAVNRLHYAQQQLNMIEADLREHQLIARDLLRQVNNLEAIIQESHDSDIYRSQGQDVAVQRPAEEMGQTLTDLYRETQNKLNDLITRGDAMRRPDRSEESVSQESETNPKKIDDDLSRRRSRLSKPK